MNKKIKLEDKYIHIIFLILITIIALIVRVVLIKYSSGDYKMFLKPWFNELKQFGGIKALSRDIGNYTPIYMTILAILTYLPIKSLVSIKIVSIIFDFLGAFTLLKIVEEILKNNKYKKSISYLIYSLYLLLPTVILNSSYWAQSDSIYSCFILISIYYLIKKDYLKGIIFFSISLSFKLQAIFILPLYILMYISERKIKLRYFLLIPLIIFILGLPKAIMSNDFLYCFKVYFNQTNSYNTYITLNFPNIYSIFLHGNNSNLILSPFNELPLIGSLLTITIFIILAYFTYLKKIKFDTKTIIEFSLLSLIICTFFLPRMHDRYLFLGSSLSLLYLVLNKEKFFLPISLELISLNGYIYLLFGGFTLNLSLLSIFYLIIVIIYIKIIINNYYLTKT